jgi:PKD repeat protein
MNQRLFNAYGHMADVNSGMRSPVGIAFDHVHNDGAATVTFTNLYAGDGSHPSVHGSYLTACLFYEIMFETSVDGNTFYPSGVTSTEAAYLQGVAHHVLTDVDSVEVDFRQPTANFSFVQNGFDFTFTNESSHDFEWMWDFGDGNTSMDENPSHTYLNGGTFDITLTATNCEFSDDTTVQVSVGTFGFDELTESDWNIQLQDQQLTINSESSQTLIIYAVDGRKVKEFTSLIGTQTVHLNQGVYLITDGKHTKRFVTP